LELTFGEDGTCYGIDYSLRGGSGSHGFRAPAMRAAIRNGRITGEVSAVSDRYELRLTLDIPITEPVASTPLASDGGEPALALRDCLAAFAADDPAGLAAFCARDFVDALAQEAQDKIARLERIPGGVIDCSDQATAALEILGGVVAGDEARLTTRFTPFGGEDLSCRGHAFLRRENGRWRVTATRMQIE
jgi:hypothetical protein